MYIHTERRSDLNVKQDDLLASKRFVIERKPDTTYFYELEEAVVLDVVLDDTHPSFKEGEITPDDWPANIDGSKPKSDEKNYGLVGRIQFRFLNSERGKDKTILNWAYPIENTGVTEYPLMNEVVIVGKYLGKYFYSRKLNTRQVLNSNASFATERITGYVDENGNVYDLDKDGKPKPYTGPTSKLNAEGGSKNYEGVLGKYFKFNPKIRALRRFEGDTIFESRFGASIRFGAYDDVRGNDAGFGGDYSDGAGNPMILVRNRQAPINKVSPEKGKTGKGYTLEDINLDGSSIHITSGLTVSGFKSTILKRMVSGTTFLNMPKLDGDQMVVNSDRVVFSAKANEMMFFSKKQMNFSTDEEITVDAEKKITMTSLESFSINAPKSYIGDHGKEFEPALLGRTSVLWMDSMCQLFIKNIDSQMKVLENLIKHQHTTKVGPTTEPFIPGSVLTEWKKELSNLGKQKAAMEEMRKNLNTLMSSRVFIAGGVD